MSTFTFRISKPEFDRLHAHLFPGDHDEHGGVITVGVAKSGRETRLLAREVFLARDGIDYIESKHGYRALSTDFVARVSDHCARHGLGYFAVHCHGGKDSVNFSRVDLASHQRGYPSLLDITSGGPVGALVFAENAVAGSVWTREGIFDLNHLVVVGANVQRFYPGPSCSPIASNPLYHRQALMFGDAGQEILRRAKVGVIGLGGAGSLINQWLAKLGVGEIVAVDFDKVEPSNHPRIVDTTLWDAQVAFSNSRWPILQKMGRLLAARKVKVARRVARKANPGIRYHAVSGDITVRDVALLLKDADYIFLCADTAQSRLVFNALVHQYLIPGMQVGAKVAVDKATGAVGDIFAVARSVLPYASGGCLLCNGLIPADKLQQEALTAEERRAQAYVEETQVTAPSVITLNAVACAQAANEFLMGYLGLLDENNSPGYQMQFCREKNWQHVIPTKDTNCLHCGNQRISVLARGDASPLPCRSA
jgi:molybdopterin/thiamine biosynthesis adenylyltransferase